MAQPLSFMHIEKKKKKLGSLVGVYAIAGLQGEREGSIFGKNLIRD